MNDLQRYIELECKKIMAKKREYHRYFIEMIKQKNKIKKQADYIYECIRSYETNIYASSSDEKKLKNILISSIEDCRIFSCRMTKYNDDINEYIKEHKSEIDVFVLSKKYNHIKNEIHRASLLVAICYTQCDCITFLEEAKDSVELGLINADSLNTAMNIILSELK